ncbi:hypothetical protein O181_059405 [Austropuccinia psidii MF-1]|uniref:Uncharacterized protein n=1 Tax=Austropuccinia psidii MF-1 TaxID=1389203 RepID=A0A9Q3EBD6_9BASI|nr:hypothetical protein [Austropuccinia psidii MF-1]
MTYSEKEELKQLLSASSCPNLSGVGEYDCMELIDVPSIPDYCITSRLNAELKGHASIWYTEIKSIYVRTNLLWWKIQILQKYSNGTWIWKNSMSLQNDKYSADNYPYEWFLKNSKRLKAIYPHVKIEMRNHKLFTQIPGELEHAVKCRFNQNCTLDDIVNILQYSRKRKNIGKYYPFKGNSFTQKHPLRVEKKDNPKEKMAEVSKKKNSCDNFG